MIVLLLHMSTRHVTFFVGQCPTSNGFFDPCSVNFLLVFKDSFNKHGYNFDDVNKIGYSRPS